MTCILSLLTEDYIMQVSDRRLTKAGRALNEPLRVVDDQANKALFIDGRFIFAYTGLARFRGKSSEEWLATLWAGDEADHNDAAKRFLRCAARLTTEFRHVGWADSIKRLAYIGVGWIGDGSATMKPALVIVTNYYGANDWLATAEDEFILIHQIKPKNRSFYLHAAGVTIPDGNWRDINRKIRRMVDHKVSPRLVSSYLIDLITLVADNNKTVGHRCMVTCIPRSVANTPPGNFMMFNNDAPSMDCRTFFYIDGAYEHWPQVGPIFSTRGSYSSNFKSSGPGTGIGIGSPENAST